MEPSVGRIVHYRVAEGDSDLYSNGVKAGDLLPAVIVRVWTPTTVNLQVLVDGSRGTAWKTSRILGTANGEWQWPARN